jgi:hypothetical protein
VSNGRTVNPCDLVEPAAGIIRSVPQVRKTMDAGAPTGVYCPVNVNPP